MIDFAHIRALTFDCYGTLIDWERGIVSALAPLLRQRGGAIASDDTLLSAYAEAESRIESGPYIHYRNVLAQVSRAVSRRFAARLTDVDHSALAGSIPLWPAFPDTPGALARLATRFRLVVLSNIDRALFELSRPHLGPAPLELISAEDVRSYKPAPAHFHEALRRLAIDASQICHVAQSLYHDIPTAQSLGFRTAWINRRRGKQGHGATPTSAATPDLEFPDLASFADAVMAKSRPAPSS